MPVHRSPRIFRWLMLSLLVFLGPQVQAEPAVASPLGEAASVVDPPWRAAGESAAEELDKEPKAEEPMADGPKADEPKAPGEDWVRVLKNDKGRPIAMQTAIVRYKSKGAAGKKEVVVDLIGAVHVGDAAYYEDLNKRFEAYDALLYELVAPEGTRIAKGTKASNRHALGAAQNMMSSTLELEHQLEKVDYTKPNFVHADMSPDEFLESMEDRDESFLKMYFRLMGQSIAHQSKATAKGASTDIDMFRAMFAEDRARRLKIVFAEQMDGMESLMTAFGGEGGSTIITERNKAALKVLREQLDAGKKKLGVFYGAAHLTDMDQRLREEFGLEPTEVTWLTAWDLAEKKKP